MFIHKFFVFYVVLFVCMCHCWTGSDTAGVLRPRGVPLSKKIFYEPSKDFSCLDGSGTFPFHFVNDDYCDCSDGSDEPGTSACPNGIFHCVNAGYISQNIPSSRVNDEICDCCDGSDEYNSSADCINYCVELGKQAKEAAQKQQELFEKGYTLWQQYTVQGKQIKENNKAKLENLKKAEEEAEKIKTEKEAIKNEAEDKEKAALSKYETVKEAKKREEEELEMLEHQEVEKLKAEDAFKELDKNQDGVLTFDEIQQFPKFDSNNDGTVSEGEAKFFLHMKNEMMIDEFVTTGWMIMKPIYMMDKLTVATPPPPIDTPPIQDETPTEEPLVQPDDEVYNPEDYESTDEESVDDEEEDDTPPEFPPKEIGSESQLHDKTEEPQYDEETQKIVDGATEARKEYKEAFDNLEKIKTEMKQVESDIEADFGPEEEFAVLKGQCFDFDDREYTYRLCPFDRASQIPKSGGSEINLGRWGLWTGLENNKYLKMKFDNGQVCWNGPARSVMVVLQCGLENKILGTSEPNRCEYHFEFSTPALCSVLHEPNNIHQHTEL